MSYTIRSSDGRDVISQAVSKDQLYWLRGLDKDGHRRLNRFGEPQPSMVRVSKKSDQIWLSLVDPAVIRGELRREIRDASSVVAAGNRTIGKSEYVAKNGRSGWYFEHRLKRAFAYVTTQASADEMSSFVLRSVIGEMVRGHGTTADFHRWFAFFVHRTAAHSKSVRNMISFIAGRLSEHEYGRLTDEQLVAALKILIAPNVQKAA